MYLLTYLDVLQKKEIVEENYSFNALNYFVTMFKISFGILFNPSSALKLFCLIFV